MKIKTIILFVFLYFGSFSCINNESERIKLQKQKEITDEAMSYFRTSCFLKQNSERYLLKIINILEKGGKINKRDTSVLWSEYRSNNDLSIKNFNDGCEKQKALDTL